MGTLIDQYNKLAETCKKIAPGAGWEKLLRCSSCKKTRSENQFNYADEKCDVCHAHKVVKCTECGGRFHAGIDGWGGLKKCSQCKDAYDRKIDREMLEYDVERDRELEWEDNRDPCPN